MLIEAGSVIGGDWLTAVSAMVFALFLTFPPEQVRNKVRASYGLLFAVFLLGFLALSYQDAIT